MTGSKIVKCVDCQREFPRKELNRKLRCPDCAIVVLRDCMTQMMEKSGPYYEKWKQACLEKAGRYAEGIKGG